MDKEEVQKLVDAKSWYHGYEIMPGVMTKGKFEVDPPRAFDFLGVPADLSGKRALDIGAWDGPYTFELERRGAQVTAFDIQDPDRTGFNTAKQILNSCVEYVRGDVLALPEEWMATFDVVFYLGVFYHLKTPLVAFQNICRALKPDGMMYFEGAILDFADRVDPAWRKRRRLIKRMAELPVAYFAREEYCGDKSNWFIPTHLCVQDWIRSTGFEIVRSGRDEELSRSWGAARKRDDFQPDEHFVA